MTERRAGFGSPFCDSHCSKNTIHLFFSLKFLQFLKNPQNKIKFTFTQNLKVKLCKVCCKKEHFILHNIAPCFIYGLLGEVRHWSDMVHEYVTFQLSIMIQIEKRKKESSYEPTKKQHIN